MSTLSDLDQQLRLDPANRHYTDQGIFPLYSAPATARLLIIGQAPGQRAQDTHIMWHDQSGQRLRQWLNVSDDFFYHSGQIAVLPMDFYFPGHGRSGDRPPRPDFASKWHPSFLALMPQLKLTLLVGSYAVHAYLKVPRSQPLTEIVAHYSLYLPHYFPLIHPSPRNRIWQARHPWFESSVLPVLRQQVHQVLL